MKMRGTSARVDRAIAGWERRPRLCIVAAGAGRDGTMTLARLMKDMAAANGIEIVSEHELYANHVCNLLCAWHETGRHCYRLALEDLLGSIPAHAVSGTTYQFALDLLAEKYGRGLKIIHLQRRDKQAFIQSLKRVIYFRPAMAVNMTTEQCRREHPDYTTRLAAFHFGEMSRPEWESLSIEQRLGWHYDKTHALLDAAARNFAHCLKLYTEDIDRPDNLRRLAAFMDPSWKKICAPVRLNAMSWW